MQLHCSPKQREQTFPYLEVSVIAPQHGMQCMYSWHSHIGIGKLIRIQLSKYLILGQFQNILLLFHPCDDSTQISQVVTHSWQLTSTLLWLAAAYLQWLLCFSQYSDHSDSLLLVLSQQLHQLSPLQGTTITSKHSSCSINPTTEEAIAQWDKTCFTCWKSLTGIPGISG